MRLTKDALVMLVHSILDAELASFTLKKNVKIPYSLVNSIDLVGTSADQHTVFKQVFVTCEPVELLVSEEVESHQVFKDDLKKHIKFGPKDEYWIVTAGKIDASCEPKGIILKDWKWIASKMKELMPKSRKLRETVHTLEAAGILQPSK